MGENEGWAQPPIGMLPNGLLPNEAAPVMRVLDMERWLKAEERTAELIACIQPNPPSEERRHAVAVYVQRLIMKCFPCQVFTFGSVPLKTYLPDGDIDLTAFSKNQNLKDAWAHQVHDMLQNEEKDENAEFHVKEVQYIQAEVKIIKCLVENIVVDISFNQLGGLCTLCFLEEVDNLIGQNHLFKRSVILIKAWCYYESRILGAHHGLISTYALETLVLYIFHVFNNSFAGPLEVLYRFLEFFSKFDWDNFCVSLWGPVPISSLPDVTAEPPRKDGGDLLLSKLFLDACSSVYAVFPAGQENQGQPFTSKHFNVIDPLRVNNNLGRSVSKGNFFRIRSAFAFGAKRLARLLDCPQEDLFLEVNQFFMNTWVRHGTGQRPDAPSSDLWRLTLSSHDHLQGSENLQKNSQKTDNTCNNEFQVKGVHAAQSVLSQHLLSSKSLSKSSSDSRANQNNARNFDQVKREANCNQGARNDKGHRKAKPNNPFNEVPGRLLFARTCSSPELTDSYSEAPRQGRHTKAPESGKGPTSSAKFENSHRKHLDSDMPASYGIRIDDSSGRKIISHQFLDSSADSNNGSNSNDNESGPGFVDEEFSSVAGLGGKNMMHQEEQDLLNMITSPTTQGSSGENHIPVNLTPGHLPLSPSILASMGCAHRNIGNIPFIESFNWGTNVQFPQGLVPSPWTPYFPGVGLTSNPEDLIETGNENFNTVETSLAEADKDFWHEQERASARGVEADNGNFEMLPDDERQSISGVYNFIPSSHVGSSSNSARQKTTSTKENQDSMREEHIDSPKYQDGRGNGAYFDDRIANPRLPSAPSSSSFRSKTSSESSWEGSSAKSSKSTREKKGKKNTSSVPSSAHGKGKNATEISSGLVDDENRQWTPLSTTASDISDRSTRPLAVAPMHVPRQPLSGSEMVRTSGSDSVLPMAPVVIGHGSSQRTGDNSGVFPFAFYPTGPPVPFVTMLPLYNFPTQSSQTSASNFHGEEDVDSNDRGQNFDPSEVYDQPEVLSSSNSTRRTAIDTSEPNPDILNGDFVSHWQNLQYGRICQNSRHPDSVIYPSSVVVPPVYLQGRFPWDGPGRPQSANVNLFTQLMNYGPQLVPVAPIHSVSNRPANIYQRFIDEIPRYRSGTGTYLPNPKVSVRDRHSTSTRRGNHNNDRSDQHGDREGNWNINSKLRTSGRSHYRSQAEKSSSRPEKLATSESHSERPWGSHRPDSFVSHQNGGTVRLNSSQNSPTNVANGMYPLPGMHSSGISSNGPTIPPVVMWYSYDHNASYSTPAEQLEFGSLGPMGFPGVNEVSLLNEGSQSGGAFEEQRFNGGTAQQSSPDQPSSPKFPRYSNFPGDEVPYLGALILLPDQWSGGIINLKRRIIISPCISSRRPGRERKNFCSSSDSRFWGMPFVYALPLVPLQVLICAEMPPERKAIEVDMLWFEDCKSESSFSMEQEDSINDGNQRRRPSLSAVLRSIGRRVESGSAKMKNLRRASTVHPLSNGQKKLPPKKKILDPQGPILQKWNKIFVITCVLAVSVDPFFFYIPVINNDEKCLDLSGSLQITASVFRTFLDLFYILRIIFQFKTGFIAPPSRVFGRGELINDPVAITKRYLTSHFIIDILSIIPLPQVIVLAIHPNMKTDPFVAKDLLKYSVLIQYVPRLLRIYPLFKEVTRTSGILTETAGAGAAYNLFLYMLASHVVGAFWYLLSVESEVRCWRRELKSGGDLSCRNRNHEIISRLNETCSLVDPDNIIGPNIYNFGIFFDALHSGVVKSTTDFPQKFFYCFWWGLRGLSSLGQNLQTSTYVPEILFAIFIAIFGLVLFSLLIGNMQKYLQSTTVRVEEMRVKRQDAEQWMSHRMLPENLKERIRRYEQYQWQENRGVEEEALIGKLPKDLRRDIKRHLCLDLVKKVPMFEKMDEQLLDAMCSRLKPVLYTEKSQIFREGDPVDEILFIMRGKVSTVTTNGGRTGFFNCLLLKAGDFCGEELLTWALDPNSSSNLPISTRTVETISEVEAFALMADDLKLVASQFRRLSNKQLQHAFRQDFIWKTWAACFIQAAWRRYLKKKIDRSLHDAEDKLQDAFAKEDGSTLSLGATIYASRFAANALRNLRENGRHNRMQQRLLPLLPQKPAEPDFTTQKL
ncbi:unnamed protein product [Sphenostylis stenocarpa]|uniref:Cyclic nucleotide-binding domain-containing protein n=1 Tax=Sphenostylis stenocarpa TaxID=92480 RepID=A0AA86VJN7_9FABA|nr:unnamed protein product [Sphenostylis stenocarpa]